MRVPVLPAPAVTTGDDNGSGDSRSSTFGIRAGVLIPGRGEPLEDGVVIVKDGTIDWVGHHTDLPQAYSSVTISRVPVVMPGMWDAHTHFIGANVVGGISDAVRQYLPGAGVLVGAILVDDLRATLEAGFTSVRELGGMAGYVWPAVQSGHIVGPNIYSAVSVLSITGGHGDQHDVPLSTVLEACACGTEMSMLCDGVEGCTRAVRQVIRRGARVIKICSTGGVLSLNDQPEDTQFSPAELTAIVEEAGRSGRTVASHAIGKNGIMAALKAGVTSIEHGMYLDEEVAALMKEKDAILVPTRHIVEGLAANPEGIPAPSLEKLRRMTELSRSSLKLAVKLGVRVALGTDTLSSDRKNVIAHGKNAMELHYAVAAGMTTLQAIEMATATPPETLGAQAPRSGQLTAGYDADIIAVSENPLDDIDVLTRQSNITHVWKGGKLYKSP